MNDRHTATRRPCTNLYVAFACALLIVCGTTVSAVERSTSTIAGRIVDASGDGVEGVMVSAIDNDHRKWTSVFTRPDGSFTIKGLRSVNHHVRTRLMGIADEWRSDVSPGTDDLTIKTRPAKGEELELQRPASSAFSMLKF